MCLSFLFRLSAAFLALKVSGCGALAAIAWLTLPLLLLLLEVELVVELLSK